MSKYLTLIAFIIMEAVNSFAQQGNITTKRFLSNSKLQLNIGVNLQFFDNPFFKLRSNRYSTVMFQTNTPKNFGLEYISGYEILRGSKLITGIYYSEADMSYSRQNTGYFGGTLSMGWRLMYVSWGVGVNSEKRLGNRWNADFSIMPVITKFLMQKGQADTSIDNELERTINPNAPPIFQNDDVAIRYPSILYTKWTFRLKNRISVSYRIGKRIFVSFNTVYNIGLPNKAFKYHFYYYKRNNMATPISYEQAIFSNSSAELNLGLGIKL